MKKLRLLIVEDDPEALYMLQFLLQEQGHHVETAANGVEALEKARREPPDMAISDILMPQMDGFTLCREWKKDEQLKRIPFVFYTATYTDPNDEEFALSLGAERFITKPTEPEVFVEILQEVITAHEEGVLAAPKEPVAEEADALQQYSERLVKKLEDKMLELDEANIGLRAREEALRLERDNLINILRAMQDGVCIVNEQYDIQYANPVLMKDFGPFEGRKCYEYFHDRTEVCPWCKNQAVFAGETVRWEWYSFKNDRTYDLIDTPLRNPDGSISKLEIFRDITERKRAEEEIRRRVDELTLLNRVATATTSTLDLQEVLQVIAAEMSAAFGVEQCALALLDESRQEATVTAEHLAPGRPSALGDIIPVEGNPTFEEILATRAPLAIFDAQQDPLLASVHHLMEKRGTKSLLIVPLLVKDEVIGTIGVDFVRSQREFSAEDVSLAQSVAGQAAVAIENARLYEQVRSRSEYLEALQEINATLRSTLPLSEVLQMIVRKTAEALGYVGAAIAVPDATGERLVLGAVSGGKIVQSALRLMGARLEAFSVPLNTEDNLLVRAFLTAELQASSGEPEGMTVGVQPSISPRVARAFERAIGAESAVCAPLLSGEAIVGVLVAISPRTRLSDEERAMLLGVADQAGLAIENARLYEDTRHRAQELAALYDVSLEMSAQLGLAPLLDTVVQRAIDLLGGFSGGLYLFDAEREELELTAARWPGGEPTGVRLALGEGVCGRIAQTGKPLVVTDYANWEGRPAKFDSGTTFSVLGVPVKLGDTLLGALYVNDADVERRFDEGDVRLAALFANQAAVAIENARLYEEVRRSAEEMATLYDISLEVAARTDLLELLLSVVREAAQLFAADSGGVYLFDLETQELELRVSYGYKKDRTGLRLGLGEEGLAGKIAQSEEPWMVNDYSQWDGRSPQWEEEALVASMGVPLRGDDLLGVLFLDRSVRGPFNDDDLKLATLFANQAAVAIENAQLLGEITEHQKDLQKLSSQLIRAQEEERKRISQELHDQMGQALTAMSINLAAIEQELGTDLDPMTRERLAETDSLIDEALDQVRDLSLELRPSMLDDLGLLSALRWYVDRYTTRADVEVEFEAVALEERLHPDLETVLYRVVQESLTNVAKHAQAGRVQVHLERKEFAVTALIEDDGVGFSVEEVRGREVDERGAGLLGIRERVSTVQGSLNVESAPGEGTRLTIEIPLK